VSTNPPSLLMGPPLVLREFMYLYLF